eukprot:m.237311 g.237311  ORF g.237311 m.237311 type:complete len:521 (+) comp16056_c0_seq4:650-2212(+)
MMADTFANIIYQNWIFDIPKIFDICAIWGRSNTNIIAKMIGNLFKKQPSYLQDLDQALESVRDIFAEMIASCSKEMKEENVLVLQWKCIDISATLYNFLSACPSEALDIIVKNDILVQIAKLYEAVVPRCTSTWITFEHNGEGKHSLRLAKLWLTFLAEQLLQFCYCRQVNVSTLTPDAEVLSVLDRVLEEETFTADWAQFRSLGDIFKSISKLPGVDETRIAYMIQVIETLSSEASPKLQSHENDQSVVTSTQAEEVADQTINKNHDDAGSADSAGASAIEAIKSIFPDFGEGFIISCLQELEWSHEAVIECILEGNLPARVRDLPRDMEKPQDNQASLGPLTSQFLENRHNVFDGDEFDIFSGKKIDNDMVHRGKREMEPAIVLDDRTSVQINKDMYLYEYEDEYDDTYDDMTAFEHTQEEETKDPSESQSGPTEPIEVNDNKKTWGPDKAPGGRVRGGGGNNRDGKPTQKPKVDLSSRSKESLIARRRKDANKASRANHNRRAGADRKRQASMQGGM